MSIFGFHGAVLILLSSVACRFYLFFQIVALTSCTMQLQLMSVSIKLEIECSTVLYACCSCYSFTSWLVGFLCSLTVCCLLCYQEVIEVSNYSMEFVVDVSITTISSVI